MAQWNPQVNELFLKPGTSRRRPSAAPFWTKRAAATPICAARLRRCSRPANRQAAFWRIRPADLPTPSSSQRRRARHGHRALQAVAATRRGRLGRGLPGRQREPVRRQVALKIQPGMDTRQVIARFEAERQALAMMDHPEYRQGARRRATDTGRPYFVMELVKGVPITDYCDQQLSTPRERLELFVAGVPGRAARSSEGHHPSRHQAVQCVGDAARRPTGRQGDRFRHRQGDRPAAHRHDAVHRNSARSSARRCT